MDNLDKLREEISSRHADTPQRQWHALAAIDAVRAGLVTLASYGHRLDLVEADDAPVVEWPKAMYHQDLGFRVAGNQDEIDSWGPGWQDKQFPPKPAVTAVSNVAPIPVVVVEAPVVAPPPPPPVPPKPVPVDIAEVMGASPAPVSEPIPPSPL